MPKTEVVDEQIDDVQIMDLPEDELGLHDESPDDSLVEVTMSGKTLKVSPEVADAINAERQGMDKKLGENAQELGELRKYQRETATSNIVVKDRPDSEAPAYDYEDAIYEDANKAVAHLKNEILQEVTQRYERDQSQRDSNSMFWDNFWREHPDLGRSEFRADAQRRILEELPRYQHLPDSAATRARMADDTRAYYLNIAKGFGSGGNNGASNYSEGAGNYQRSNSGKQEEGFRRPSTSEILKRNRAKKNQALLENK